LEKRAQILAHQRRRRLLAQMRPTGSYGESIQEATGCPDNLIAMVEMIMRDDFPGRGTLDMLSPEEFDKYAREAAERDAYNKLYGSKRV